MEKIKVLTLKEPWASAIFKFWKDVENRSRPTKYRGRLYVHTSQKVSQSEMDKTWYWIKSNVGFYTPFAPTFGAIIGYVDLVDCITNSPSKWAMEGHYHWLMENPVLLDKPIPAKGQLGIWNLPCDQLT
jgi:hypothetical protein